MDDPSQPQTKFKIDEAAVFLASEEHGEEEFRYPSKSQALTGFYHLLRSATNYTQQDGVTRRVGFVIEATNINLK